MLPRIVTKLRMKFRSRGYSSIIGDMLTFAQKYSTVPIMPYPVLRHDVRRTDAGEVMRLDAAAQVLTAGDGLLRSSPDSAGTAKPVEASTRDTMVPPVLTSANLPAIARSVLAQ